MTLADASIAPAVLDRAREASRPALRVATARLEPPLARVAAYHMGWADEAGRELPGNGGKALRPALALLSAEAVGAPTAVGVPGAVAVELVHNFSLIHDDLMDGDEERRHRPTAWKVFGPGLAVLAGDGLLVLAEQVLMDADEADGDRAARLLTEATARLIDGQSQDLSFEARLDVTVEECLTMAGNKTGALLACASAIGAALAGADERTVQALYGFGHHLGVAFQAVDDLLGIWGRPEVTGKPAWNDLRRRKKSVPVVAALASDTTAGRELARIYTDEGPRNEEGLALAARLVEEAGGRARTETEAARRLEQAMACLDSLDVPQGTYTDLTSLAAFTTTREL
ncbi:MULTISPECIES: polyprenyl synthetase family protein [Embleya]|uniref:Dimethylallyltranstransferase n=2 Tax=Embleya TaxID=2699295 RepID=A0A1T3NV42_9ACTN|nr:MULTISPECIES: polyprenyl synthetase family protein [Embleya]OPC80530.1 dimethylallyltranstransferase [Embleya scabrispora]GCD97508.1 dimethylallyltransferase [Embleya hyalina]